jgi:hypothetical protein
MLENLNGMNLKDFVYWKARTVEEMEQKPLRVGESYLEENKNKRKINRKKKPWKKTGENFVHLFKLIPTYESVNNDDITRIDESRRRTAADWQRHSRSCETFWRRPFRT